MGGRKRGGWVCFTFQSSGKVNMRQDYRRRWWVFIMQHRYNSSKTTRSGPACWPDGDTHVAMQETQSSNLNLGFSCPRSEKKRRNTVDCAFKSEGGDTYVTTIAISAEKCEHSSLRISLAPFWSDATVSLDHVQRGEKALHLIQQKQITGGQDSM